MKWALICIGIIDAFLVMIAVVRLMTATPDTATLASEFASSREAPAAQTATTAGQGEAQFGETGEGAKVVDHLRADRVDEISQTGEIATSQVQSNTEYNASKALDRASTVTDQREGDLDEAKKKIGKVGK